MSRVTFARKWSMRFVRYRGKAKDPHRWCDQLCAESLDCNWIRLIVPTWHQQKFTDAHSTQGVMHWLEDACMHPALVKQRSYSDLSTGVQVWLSHQEDVAAFYVCVPDPVQNMRYFSCVDARVNWLEHWQPQHNPYVRNP